jgi:hypothetical protein
LIELALHHQRIGVARSGLEHLRQRCACGRSIIDPPSGGFPVDRLAWLLAPPGATFVPATGPGAWLMSILPRSGGHIE